MTGRMERIDGEVNTLVGEPVNERPGERIDAPSLGANHTAGRLGLRTRVTVAFALGSLLIALVLAGATYWAARHYLIQQRETTALSQAYADAALVASGLSTSGMTVSKVLEQANAPHGSTILLRVGNRWYSTALGASPNAVPSDTIDCIGSGTACYGWTSVNGDPTIVAAVPLAGLGAEFYELISAAELETTLSTIRVILILSALLALVIGAILGRLTAARLMEPLDSVATAAARISGGELTTRLPPTADRDLATIVAAFNTMVETVEERTKRDARFAADVGHELRSPLTTLVASFGVISRRRDELPERVRSAVDLADVELERFGQTLDDLLELGRLEAGVRGQVTERVDVAELVMATLEASHRPQTLIVRTELGLIVEVDKSLVSRALVNLLDNADRHGDGVSAVRVSRRGGLARVDVEDRGPGVAENDRARVFERFVRAGSRASKPGSGLGLSLVAESADAIGGRVWCEDNPAGGARFTLTIPLFHESLGGEA